MQSPKNIFSAKQLAQLRIKTRVRAGMPPEANRK